MFPLFLSVNKSLLKEQILIDLFYHHLATHLQISFSTPEEILTVTTRAIPSRRCMHHIFQLHGYSPNVKCQGRISFSLSSLLSLSVTC
jgi:hypothetical protein